MTSGGPVLEFSSITSFFVFPFASSLLYGSMAKAISSLLAGGEGWDERLQSSLFTGGRLQAVAEAGQQEGVVQPSYGAWILALGVLAIASALVVIALLTNVVQAPWVWSNRSLAAAYALALLASFNLMVMHLIVHALSPAGQALIGMTWNEAFFWRSAFCLAFSLPYLWYVPACPWRFPSRVRATCLLPAPAHRIIHRGLCFLTEGTALVAPSPRLPAANLTL